MCDRIRQIPVSEIGRYWLASISGYTSLGIAADTALVIGATRQVGPIRSTIRLRSDRTRHIAACNYVKLL